MKTFLPGAMLCITLTATAGTLSIRTEPPDAYGLLMHDPNWYVALSGEIDEGAPERVEQALRAISAPAQVYLDSPGGNLFAGMRLGQVLRKAEVITQIGSFGADYDKTEIAGRHWLKFTPGRCFSACTLAFLGGVYRYASDGSLYGVHRFFRTSGERVGDLDAAQVISAAIGNYIREMDVDPGLFDLMASQGKEAIRVLTKDEMTRLRVVNNGRGRPEWSIEAIEGGQYLRGMQDSVYGRGKTLFVCIDGKIVMQSFYQVGSEKAKNIESGGWFHSLLLDDGELALADPIQTKANGDEIYSMFMLTPQQARSVAKSTKSVGHAMQRSREAAVFVGYRVEVPVGARNRIQAFIGNCVH